MTAANGMVNWKTGTVTISLASIIAFAVVAYSDLSGKTQVAIQVARDHGTELKLLREDYTTLRGELHTMLSMMIEGTDDRFRGTDWERERKWIERRLDELEERCCE